MSPYPTEAVANYFLDKATNAGSSLTAMKLQKLVFFAHGWCLGLYEKPLLDELAEAWNFGPVFPSIYHEFKCFGSQPIESKARRLDMDSFEEVVPEISKGEHHQETRDLLNRIWDVYGEHSAGQLSRLTHASQSPWSKTVKPYDNNPPRNLNIPNDTIEEYFKEQAEAGK